MNEHFHFTHMRLSCLLGSGQHSVQQSRSDCWLINKPNDHRIISCGPVVVRFPWTFVHPQHSVLHSVPCCFPWQVWKGRRTVSVFRETRASINHICLWNVQILDIVSLPSSVFTLFECICSGDKPMCCHKSGLGTVPSSSSNYWGRVQCHAHSFRLLQIWCHKQDFPAQVKICRAQNAHTYVCKHMLDITLNQWLLLERCCREREKWKHLC